MPSPAPAAPSHVFLAPSTPTAPLHDRGTAFLGADTGFLPVTPLPPLPPSHAAWSRAASQLPSVAKSAAWHAFLASFPPLSADALPDPHLLRANACLGAVAHAVRNVADLPVPPRIMRPWTAIAARLARPTASFNSLDWFLYNFALVPHRFVSTVAGDCPRDHAAVVTDPWRQTSPYLTVTGCMTETHFITGCFAIEHAARRLPGVVARAQNAVLARDNLALKAALVEVVYILESMTIAFQSADVRPQSRTYVDQVEWGRCIGVAGLPVVEGEKTISGLLFPSVHLLDVFFSREGYRSEMGVLEHTDRKWLPPLHRDFLDAVSKVSVFDYICSLHGPEDTQLMCVFRRALSSFAHESGFLGKHRLRIIGFLELSMKVGRPATAAGTKSPAWQNRMWRHINHAMLDGMHERQERCLDRYYAASVQSCNPLDATNKNAHRLVIDMHGAMVYEPGDHLAILPENNDELVRQTLSALQLEPSVTLKIRNVTWIRAFSDRGLQSSQQSQGDCVDVTAEEFFRIASLQPLDRDLGYRLVENMFVTNPAVADYLREERASSVPIALGMLSETGCISTHHLLSRLDTVFQPLQARYYSITSHMSFTPTSIEVVIGRVLYPSHSRLSFRYGLTPWKTRTTATKPLDTESAREHLASYLVTPQNRTDDAETLPSQTSDKRSEKINGNMTNEPLEAARAVCTVLSETAGHAVKNLSAKARFRSQVICHDATHNDKVEAQMNGISSTFLSKLVPGSTVRAQIIPELDFHIPEDRNVPIIMISLGTGVAPFRSFMKELIKQKKRAGTPGRRAWLILGLRTKEHIPFLEDFEEAACKEKVLHLSMAFSNEDVDLDLSHTSERLEFRPGSRKRIQGLFEQDPEVPFRFWEMIMAGGHIYACGRPELEPLVRELLAFTVKRFATTLWSSTFFDTNYDLQNAAREFADRLASEKRLHIDCYYSGQPAIAKALFSPADVAEHRTMSSCWVSFRRCVYDITKYLAVHPGGPKILWDKAGRDMTTDFDEAHGADNLRIASMVEPYKIGSLKSFTKASGRIKGFMEAWSIPLLHGILEYRSVFSLDLNDFPTLKEPSSFVSWKSQISAPNGAADLCQKFWYVHEPEAFEYLTECLSPEKLGKALQPLKGLRKEKIDSTVLMEELTTKRYQALSTAVRPSQKMESADAHVILKQYVAFMDNLVKICIKVQRQVEEALDRPHSVFAIDDVCTVMMSGIFRSLCDGIEEAYTLLTSEGTSLLQ